MKKSPSTILTVFSILLIAFVYWAFTTGWNRGRANLWSGLTNSTQMILIHSDGKIISFTEQFGPKWDNVKWQAWSAHDTNTEGNISKIQNVEDTVRQWLNDTGHETNRTRTFKIIEHQ